MLNTRPRPQTGHPAKIAAGVSLEKITDQVSLPCQGKGPVLNHYTHYSLGASSRGILTCTRRMSELIPQCNDAKREVRKMVNNKQIENIKWPYTAHRAVVRSVSSY